MAKRKGIAKFLEFVMPEPKPRATIRTGNSDMAARSQKATMDSQTGVFTFEDMDVEPVNTQFQNISRRTGMFPTRKP